MRPERRFKPGMDGGLTAAVLISPPHHLRTAEILSKRWGPPHTRSWQSERCACCLGGFSAEGARCRVAISHRCGLLGEYSHPSLRVLRRLLCWKPQRGVE